MENIEITDKNMCAAEKVKDYLKDKGIRIKWFEEKIGMPYQSLQNLLFTKKPFPRKYWKKVMYLTKYKVTLEDLAQLYEFEDVEN